MFRSLRYPAYRRLYLAHIVALLGTGLSTIAIGLLAVDIAGNGAAAALGIILSIKMLTYLLIAPVAPLIARKVGARRLLVTTDLLRAGVALALPFVGELWQGYLLIFVLQAASALFTPTYQASIPLIVTDEREYTGALALSRLAYDLEALLSPVITAAILVVVPSQMLFFGTGAGFLASGLLILSVLIPQAARPPVSTPFREQLTRGSVLLIRVPTLRALLMLQLTLATAGAVILVLTLPLARTELGASESQATTLLSAFGLGCILSSVLMHWILDRIPVRIYMLTGSIVLTGAVAMLWPALTLFSPDTALYAIAGIWFFAGLGYSATLAPMGRVIRATVGEADLSDVFAAQFSLAHGWWLLSYPLAGFGSSLFGSGPTSLVLVLIAGAALVIAWRSWPLTGADAETTREILEVRRG